MDRLSDNIYEVYVGDKIKNVKNISAYTLAWTLFLQIFLGNERSYKFSFVVSSISGIIAAVSNAIFNFNKKYYNESIENLDNLTKELILLGYDLDACLLDETLHNDITKVIKRGLNKSKQDKK